MRRSFLLAVSAAALAALAGCSVLGPFGSDTPPTAVILAAPTAGRAPLHVEFDATGSLDDGAIARYRWTFNPEADSASVDGARVEHTFETAGTHTIRLAVTDAGGLVGTAEVAIVVENTPPLAGCRFSSDSPIVGEWVLFDASTSYDPDGRLVDFVWDFGDGESARGTRVGHAYEAIGVYTVRLTVEDDGGATASIVHTFTVHLGGSGGGCGGGGAVCLDLT